MRLVSLLILALLAGGCAAPQVPPPTDAIVVSQSLSFSQYLWKQEALRRFPNPLLIIGHGGYVAGVWCVFPDLPDKRPTLVPIPVKWLVHCERMLFPGRIIVLVICNERHDRSIDEPGAFYALSAVWTTPDLDEYHGFPMPPEYVGSIFEFVGKPLP